MVRSLLIALLLLAGQMHAQSPQPPGRRELTVQPGRLIPVAYEQPYTSALLLIPRRPGEAAPSLTDTYLLVAGDTLRIHPDAHGPADQLASVLCVFRQPAREVKLYTGRLAGAVSLVTLYAPPLPAGPGQTQVTPLARQRADCEKPTVVPASVWRAGLPPPKSPPSATKVQFVIVHHSAGSNTTTNFTDEVRNIYLQHTQVNGWNDVGYNFLIGRDGVIYEGRDGQGVLDGDNVLGAHFCGQNSGTMGICLMGNFNDASPSPASLVSLEQLIGWKLKKEGLRPVGIAFHAGSAKPLNLISGHRDGVCATECPGDNLYAALPTIRQAVGQTCFFLGTLLATEPTSPEWAVFPNPARGTLFVQHPTRQPAQVRFELFDGLGRNWPLQAAATATDRWRLSAQQTPPGLYWLRCTDGPTSVVRSVWWNGE